MSSYVTNVDISSSTPPKTAIKRGDYNAADSVMMYCGKKTGAGTGIRRGYACTTDNTVTPNVFSMTTAKAGGTVVISALPYYFRWDYVNVTNAADGNGEDLTADDNEVSFQALIDCERVCVKASGAIQPGAQVMTAANGCFAVYDGSGPQFIKGTYVGKPGGTSDGAYIKQACADGDLIVIDFDGQ